jgi:hypothetical protein
MQILVYKYRGQNLNLEDSETLSIDGCCKSLSRWMMRFLQRKWHRPPLLPSSPTMKSSIRDVGMNPTLTTQGLCCLPMCRMMISHNKSWQSKGPSSGVWTTFYNVCSSTWCPCSYKGNFPSMPIKTIVKILVYMHAPYIQIVIINI